MKKLLLFAIISVMLMASMVSAATSAVYKIGDPVNLKVSCKNNGTICGSSVLCNLTVYYELNGNVLVQDGKMTYTYSYYNYTVPASNDIGTYKGTMYCIDTVTGMGGVTPFSYELTSTGDNKNWILFLILGLFSVILLVIGMYSGNEYIMFIAGASVILTGVYSLIYGVGNVFNMYTRTIGLICIGIGAFFMIIASIKAIAEASGEGDETGGDDYDYYKSED
jgi:hypothetical protein